MSASVMVDIEREEEESEEEEEAIEDLRLLPPARVHVDEREEARRHQVGEHPANVDCGIEEHQPRVPREQHVQLARLGARRCERNA